MPESNNDERRIRKLPITDPEARDEGPRLIPLPERRRATRPYDATRRYVDLADRAMKDRRLRPRKADGEA